MAEVALDKKFQNNVMGNKHDCYLMASDDKGTTTLVRTKFVQSTRSIKND